MTTAIWTFQTSLNESGLRRASPDVSADQLALRLQSVRANILDAASQAGRDASTITTIVVTKFHPASLVRDLFSLGAHDFGESRHQEAEPKAAALADLDATWHFIGQLQSKKARAVREYSTVIHSVDRASLVHALEHSLNEHEQPTKIFLQVNLTDDPARGGVSPHDLDPLVDLVASAAGLQLLGLMVVAPIDAEPRRAFATVRALSERVTHTLPEASSLSMGMSGDYREAILEGATHLRIGTAITGNRPTPG
jgi:pyridoxal phosphate enzyme (YggS family)